jgi:ABC-type bacteriocin/lantibiotic exporter with double-glycine peptidase domain
LQGLAVLVVGTLLVMDNDGFTVGMLVAFQMFAGRLSQPMLRLVGLYQEFQQASLAVKRLGDIMNVPREPHSLLPARTGSGPGRVQFEAVCFRYRSGVQPFAPLFLAPNTISNIRRYGILTPAQKSHSTVLRNR